MDQRSVYSLSVLSSDPDASEDSRSQTQAYLREFILEFRLDNAFIYRYAKVRGSVASCLYCDLEIRFERTS